MDADRPRSLDEQERAELYAIIAGFLALTVDDESGEREQLVLRFWMHRDTYARAHARRTKDDDGH